MSRVADPYPMCSTCIIVAFQEEGSGLSPLVFFFGRKTYKGTSYLPCLYVLLTCSMYYFFQSLFLILTFSSVLPGLHQYYPLVQSVSGSRLTAAQNSLLLEEQKKMICSKGAMTDSWILFLHFWQDNVFNHTQGKCQYCIQHFEFRRFFKMSEEGVEKVLWKWKYVYKVLLGKQFTLVLIVFKIRKKIINILCIIFYINLE